MSLFRYLRACLANSSATASASRASSSASRSSVKAAGGCVPSGRFPTPLFCECGPVRLEPIVTPREDEGKCRHGQCTPACILSRVAAVVPAAVTERQSALSLSQWPSQTGRTTLVDLCEAAYKGRMSSPPGTPSALFANSIREIPVEECLDLLAASRIGRVAWCGPDGPQIVPMNIQLLEGTVVFRTAAYSALAQAVRGATVAVEVDEISDATRSGWSGRRRSRAGGTVRRVARRGAARGARPLGAGRAHAVRTSDTTPGDRQTYRAGIRLSHRDSCQRQRFGRLARLTRHRSQSLRRKAT